MSDKVAITTKPQLRGLLHNRIKNNLYVAFGLCVVAGLSIHFLHNNKRKQVYAEFYKTYDINKEFERMRSKGLFDSC